MANHVSHGALPFPVKNARYTVLVPYLDADGDPTDPVTPDTEVSKDGAAFADAAEEATTITGSNGMAYITLTGAETDVSILALAAKVTSGPKNTLMTLFPRVLPVLENGTAQAGAAGSITLALGAAAYSLVGCIVRTTGGTGGGGTGGANNQARVITAYDAGTKAATVVPNWETNPDGTTTYDILVTEMAVNALVGRFLRPTVDGRTFDVSAAGEGGLDWANIGSPTTAQNLSATNIDVDQVVASVSGSVGSVAAGGITASSIATGAIDADAIAADAVTEIRSLVSGTSDSGSTTTMVDAARTEADTDYWKGAWILFTSGAIANQCRLITAFDPATDTITFAPATTQAVSTQTYEILPAANVDLRQWLGTTVNALIAGRVDSNTQAMAADVITAAVIAAGAIDAATFAAGAIDAAAIAADAITAAKIANGAIDAATFAAGAIDAAAIATNAIDADALAADALTEIKTQVTDALNVDTYAEPGQEAPPATTTLVRKLGYLYKFLRNRATVTSTTINVFNDDGTTVAHKATHSDDGTTYDRNEYITGP